MLKSLLSTAALLAIFAAGSAFAADPASTTPPMNKGGMFVTASGMTLYTFDKDAGGKSACNGPCAANWPPLIAAADARPDGDWTIITRDDGARQWAYKGKPVYLWAKDRKPGDKTGDGFNSVWHVAK
jgi:predicted lipoprotein with Yx(FWY)xxD motif